MPPSFRLDNGVTVTQSDLQKKVWAMWNEFWNEWVPQVTKGNNYVIVNNADTIDGQHHGSVHQITHNIKDQTRMAIECLRPQIEKKKCIKYFQIRGTEAHVGKSGQGEEGIGEALGAVKDELGNSSRWELWLRMKKYLIHFTHHVGTTSSANYESTAVYKELIEAYVEAARWGLEPPDAIIRSHRHREFTIPIKTYKGNGIGHVTGSWQLKTPFTFRIGLGRSSSPQIGGSLITSSESEGLYIRSRIWNIDRPKEEQI